MEGLHSITVYERSDNPGGMARNTSIVVDPVTAVLPAEVTKTIRHINNNREREREKERERERERDRERERERERDKIVLRSIVHVQIQITMKDLD